MAAWLWRSLELGKPADLRYEDLANLSLANQPCVRRATGTNI
jgi:hypothetical protein